MEPKSRNPYTHFLKAPFCAGVIPLITIANTTQPLETLLPPCCLGVTWSSGLGINSIWVIAEGFPAKVASWKNWGCQGQGDGGPHPQFLPGQLGRTATL